MDQTNINKYTNNKEELKAFLPSPQQNINLTYKQENKH